MTQPESLLQAPDSLRQSHLRVVPCVYREAAAYVINRVATDGCPNACSALYGAAKRAAKSLGYSRLITYIRDDEPGTSLRGAGWNRQHVVEAGSWDVPSRPRVDKTEIVPRQMWSSTITGPSPVAVHWPEVADKFQLTLDEVGDA